MTDWPQREQPATAEPDWAALAERHDRDTRRRKRLRLLTAGGVATAAVAAITVTAVVVSGGSGHGSRTGGASTAIDAVGGRTPPTSASTSASPSPATGPSTPADPLTLISDARTDTAPLDPAALFAAGTLSSGGRIWTRMALDSVTPCWKATTGGLGNVLAAQNCQTVLRATYASGAGAVTVGVAVFAGKEQATAAQQASKGQLQGLVPTGAVSFCTAAGCANTHGTIGRYTYYSVSGTLKPGGTAPDADAAAAGPVFADYASTRLLARG
ncbi:hypothetical protein P3T36_002810 [Kitasatospora sp. MAP12-15]|uniref:hypothetical protein n=1 Tax=unclassified Kitasatospora TaxID=2633591 RepID=UPI0024733039|nr:hypothetical protein [Kitasatospora sp. MAP12-44]MDH6113989.1 hypothetical protein [Kitasatospora sp. MAP12-44]